MNNIKFFLQRERNSLDSDFLYTLLIKDGGGSGHIIVGQSSELSKIVDNHIKLDSYYGLKKDSNLQSTDKSISAFDGFVERRLVDTQTLDLYRSLYESAKNK